MCGNRRSKEEEWVEEEITSFIYMRKNAKIQIGNFVILIDRQADTEESPKLSSIVIGGHTQQSKLPIAGSIDRLIDGLKTLKKGVSEMQKGVFMMIFHFAVA